MSSKHTRSSELRRRRQRREKRVKAIKNQAIRKAQAKKEAKAE